MRRRVVQSPARRRRQVCVSQAAGGSVSPDVAVFFRHVAQSNFPIRAPTSRSSPHTHGRQAGNRLLGLTWATGVKMHPYMDAYVICGSPHPCESFCCRWHSSKGSGRLTAQADQFTLCPPSSHPPKPPEPPVVRMGRFDWAVPTCMPWLPWLAWLPWAEEGRETSERSRSRTHRVDSSEYLPPTLGRHTTTESRPFSRQKPCLSVCSVSLTRTRQLLPLLPRTFRPMYPGDKQPARRGRETRNSSSHLIGSRRVSRSPLARVLPERRISVADMGDAPAWCE